MKLSKRIPVTPYTLRKATVCFKAAKVLLASIFFYVLILAPDPVRASCEPFSVPEEYPLDTIVTEIFESDLEGNQRQPGSFTETWAKYTLNPVSKPASSLIHIALGYRAIEGGFHAAALSSFEIAFVQTNISNLCESKLLQFLIFSGRAHSTLAVMEGNSAVMSRPALGAGTYRTVTSSLNRPEARLVSDDLELLACVVRQFAIRRNLVDVNQSIESCLEG